MPLSLQSHLPHPDCLLWAVGSIIPEALYPLSTNYIINQSLQRSCDALFAPIFVDNRRRLCYV